MRTRTENAARTRRALLDAAITLVDSGGPEAVTLRAVGDGAGVSRGAAYRHFADKDALLTAIAVEAWGEVAHGLEAIVEDDSQTPADALRSALIAISDLGRARPHLYRLMFSVPADGDMSATAAGERAQDGFLALVERVTGRADALPIAGLLFAVTHGLTDLDLSGHLPRDKWAAGRHELLELAVARLT
ncbi:TetR/AcrR family transcriptional regulator [Gordonia sp. DT30]|uniref:TetR/AcrR family transcriptional regulator n=1 Tax=unclassified Gordonia (in: high G+C Gram-positive bacteria) TaxID=2657482 RepID=UPI003CE87399